eukprot:1158284-Pleurochrysis_carterae.AAC.1
MGATKIGYGVARDSPFQRSTQPQRNTSGERKKKVGKEGEKGTGLIAREHVLVMRVRPTIVLCDFVGYKIGARISHNEKLVFVSFRDRPYWSILYRPTLTKGND